MKKGITLIALTITILIMIILSSAAIGSVIGLVSVARVDGYEMNSKMVREQVDVLYDEVLRKKDKEDDFATAFAKIYVDSSAIEPSQSLPNTIPNSSINIISERFNMTATEIKNLDYYRFDDEKSKEILGIEDNDLDYLVNFENNIVFSIKPIKFKGEDVYTIEEIDDKYMVTRSSFGISDVKIGDTIIYDPTAGVKDPSVLTYTSKEGIAGDNFKSGNGRTLQTFIVSDSQNEFIVIGKENDRLKILSKSAISNNGNAFQFHGAVGFLFLEEEIHKLCSIFGYGLGADKSLITEYEYGYQKSKDYPYYDDKIKGSAARSLMLEDLELMTNTPLRRSDKFYTSILAHFPMFDSNDNGQSEYPEDDFLLTNKRTTNTEFVFKSEYNKLAKTDIFKTTCILADRFVNSSGSYVEFQAVTTKSNEINGSNLFRSSSGSSSFANLSGYIRPVVYLRPGVKLEKGSSADSWKVLY